VLSGRICRDNGIAHRLTQPRHPTTTGKIDSFHGSLRRELLNDAVPFTNLAAKEIMRMLQRYIARELYPLITDPLRSTVIAGLT
jgi:transposase InsO family protein